jgi:hypothetical protein
MASDQLVGLLDSERWTLISHYGVDKVLTSYCSFDKFASDFATSKRVCTGQMMLTAVQASDLFTIWVCDPPHRKRRCGESVSSSRVSSVRRATA